MTPTPTIRLTTTLLLAAAALMAGCDPTPVPPAKGTLATIDIRAEAATVAARGTVRFSAVGHDQKGNAVELTPIWSTTAGGTIVSDSGLFTAGARAGTFIDAITVQSDGITARATVTITVGSMLAIDITPGAATLAANARVQFVATGRDSFGNSFPLAPTWSVTAGGGTITPAGIFTAGSAAGVFPDTIRADQNGITARATVTVGPGSVASMTVMPRTINLAPGATTQFTVVGADADGNPLSVTPSWSALQGGTITSTGLFTAGSLAGLFSNAVRANIGSISSYASVQITAGVLARLTLSPITATMPVNGVQQFFVVGRDAQGNVIPTNPVWSVANGGGTISSTGLFTAGRSAGVFTDTIKVTSGALADYVTVTITADSLAVITVTPSTATLAAGTTQLFTGFGRDVNGNAVAISPTWSASAGGTINSAGLFTAGTQAGVFTNAIRAVAGGITGLATITISPGPLASIEITSPSTTLAMNSTLQFTARGIDANGNTVSLTPTWDLVVGGGTISPLGLFTSGTLAGTFVGTIRATSGTFSATASVTVTPGMLATIQLSPASPTLNIGATQVMMAFGRDAFNNAVALTPVWSVTAGGGAIDTFGTFTAGTVSGTFPDTIRATSGTIVGRTSVTVNGGALASIAITGNTPGVNVNGTRQLLAEGRDANANLVPVTVVWSVTAGGGSINSGTGLFTAGTLAGTYVNTVRATSGTLFATATMTVTSSLPSPNGINLGGAAGFAILAGTAIGNTGGTAITGDVGLTPGPPTAVTGFAAGSITGTLHVNDAQATTAQNDLTSAYLAAQGAVCPTGNDKSGIDLGAFPFAAGVYCFSSTAGLTGTLVLDGGGDSNAVFIFQVSSALTTSPGSGYVLQNGARAANVFWVLGSSGTLGVNSSFPGSILALTDFTMNTGASLLGRGLVRNGTVTLDTNPITLP